MSHPPIKKKMSQGKPLLLPLALVILVVWLGWRFWLAYQPEPVHLQGQIEAQQYSVSSKVPGRIDEVLVKKGDQLSKDQLVFTLASPEIEAKLSQAKAGEAAAGAVRPLRAPWRKRPRKGPEPNRSPLPRISGKKPRPPQPCAARPMSGLPACTATA